MGPTIPVDKKREELDERELPKKHEQIISSSESVRRLKRHQENERIVDRNIGKFRELMDD